MYTEIIDLLKILTEVMILRTYVANIEMTINIDIDMCSISGNLSPFIVSDITSTIYFESGIRTSSNGFLLTDILGTLQACISNLNENNQTW